MKPSVYFSSDELCTLSQLSLLLLQQQQIITSLIDPVVFISLYIITAGMKDSDDRVISQPIACPQAG